MLSATWCIICMIKIDARNELQGLDSFDEERAFSNCKGFPGCMMFGLHELMN